MSDHRDPPDWLVPEPYTDTDLGVLKTGKEAQVSLVERTGPTGGRCLLARKLYLPRQVSEKGVLEAMGVQRSSQFRNDVTYREGRQFRKSRDRRAVERMSTHGKALLQERWTNHEHDVMGVLWDAGVRVPYPVKFAEDRFDMEYVGNRAGAAPTLAAPAPARSAARGDLGPAGGQPPAGGRRRVGPWRSVRLQPAVVGR